MFVWRKLLFLWLMSELPFLASDDWNISAEPGENVTFPCDVRIGGSIRAVQWSRTDQKDEHVLLYKDKQLVPDFQLPSYKDRVDLNRTYSNVSLILKNVTADDEGTYECQILVRRRKRFSTLKFDTFQAVPPDRHNTTAEPGHGVNLSSKVPDEKLEDWKTTEQQDKHPDPDYQKKVREEDKGQYESLGRQKRSIFGPAICIIRLSVVPRGTTEDTRGHPGETATEVYLGLGLGLGSVLVVVVVVGVVFILLKRKKGKEPLLFNEESESDSSKITFLPIPSKET